MMDLPPERVQVVRLMRYVFNGCVATGVHYGLLSLLAGPFGLRPFAVANLLAATAGIAASFFGNRQFVFRAVAEPARRQAAHFVMLYAVLALVHSACMYAWCDQLGKDYQTGFVAATALQFLLSYIANSRLVFKTRQQMADHP